MVKKISLLAVLGVGVLMSVPMAWSQNSPRIHEDPIKRLITETYLVGAAKSGRVNHQLVLWVVDNSGSMEQYQNVMADLVLPSVQALIGTNWDMALVTTDPMVAPRGLDPQGSLNSSTPHPDVVLSTWFQQVGTGGSGEEQGFDALAGALSGLPSSIKARAKDVTVVFITDAPNPSRMAPNEFMDQLRHAFAQPVQISMVAMIATTNQCGTNDSVWQYPGSIFEQVGNLADRHTESWLCSGTNGRDVSQFIKSGIRGDSNSLVWTYSLSQRPIDATIEVVVQGRALPRATAQQFGYWAFDSAENAVVVTSLPDGVAANDELTIRYRF